MKKIAILSVILFFTTNVFAQGNEGESNGLNLYRLDASIGLYTSKDIYTALKYGNHTVWGESSTATFFLSTSFYKHKRLEVGMAFGYQRPNLQDPNVFTPGNAAPAGVLEVEYYTLMPQLRINWVTSEDELFEMYSIVGFALTFVNEQYSNESGQNNTFPLPGGHATGLGIRFGKELGGFVEIGLGTKGMMSAGISYRLNE